MIASQIMQILGTDEIHLMDTRTGLIKSMPFLDYLDTREDERAQNCLAFTTIVRATLESMRILARLAQRS